MVVSQGAARPWTPAETFGQPPEDDVCPTPTGNQAAIPPRARGIEMGTDEESDEEAAAGAVCRRGCVALGGGAVAGCGDEDVDSGRPRTCRTPPRMRATRSRGAAEDAGDEIEEAVDGADTDQAAEDVQDAAEDAATRSRARQRTRATRSRAPSTTTTADRGGRGRRPFSNPRAVFGTGRRRSGAGGQASCQGVRIRGVGADGDRELEVAAGEPSAE